MIETKVPKDIRTYDIKIAGPLTIRQVILCIIAICVDILVYKLVLSRIGVEIKYIIYIVIFLDVPIMSFSFKPMNMPMEKYIRIIFRNTFIRPAIRKTKNVIVEKEKFIFTEKEQKQVQKQVKNLLKEHPEYKAYY